MKRIEFLSLNRILLLAVGLWPYQQSYFVQLQQILFFTILISYIIFQFTVLLTSECTFSLVITIFSTTSYCAIFVVNYNLFWNNTETVKSFLQRLKHLYNELRDENEIAVMEKQRNNGHRYTLRIIILTIVCGFVILFVPLWPRFLDIILPTNETRTLPAMHLMTEYFVDKEKYFYLILLHMNAVICIGAIANIGVGTTIIVSCKYICGMFRIASYRIERAIEINNSQISLKNEIITHKRLISAVDAHRKAIEFCKSLISAFEGTLFFLLTICVSCLSFNLFRMFQTLTLRDRDGFLLHLVFVVSILIYMFLGNYFAQELIDHNNDVYSTVYNVRWYVASLRIQKLILLVIQRGNKAFILKFGGIYTASLKCFASLTSTSISYFTVMYSTQQ